MPRLAEFLKPIYLHNLSKAFHLVFKKKKPNDSSLWALLIRCFRSYLITQLTLGLCVLKTVARRAQKSRKEPVAAVVIEPWTLVGELYQNSEGCL